MIFTSPRAASFRGLGLSVLRLQPIRRRGAQPFKGRCNLGTFLSFLSDLCPSALPLCKQQSYRRYRLLPRSVSQYLSVYDSCCMASYFKLRCDGLPHLAIAPAQRGKKKQNNRGGHSQKKKRDNNPPLCLQNIQPEHSLAASFPVSSSTPTPLGFYCCLLPPAPPPLKAQSV